MAVGVCIYTTAEVDAKVEAAETRVLERLRTEIAERGAALLMQVQGQIHAMGQQVHENRVAQAAEIEKQRALQQAQGSQVEHLERLLDVEASKVRELDTARQ